MKVFCWWVCRRGRRAAHGTKEHIGEGRAAECAPWLRREVGPQQVLGAVSAGAQSRGITCLLSERSGTGAGGTAEGQRGKDVSTEWPEGSVSQHSCCSCCCLPPLVLLPSAGIAYDTALVGSSAAAFCAPVVFAADFVGCCCGAGPWRYVPFLVLILIPFPLPVEVHRPWCCTGTPQCTKLARLCNTGAFLPLLYWCVERLSFVLKLNLATAYFCPLRCLNNPL